MARRSRLVINREALDEVDRALADGAFDIAREILYESEASAPDATPYGEGLVMRGAALAWAGRKKVNQSRIDGGTQNVRKPRGSSGLKDGQILAIVGWGFPAFFQELGTVHQPARPFLLPAAMRVVGSDAKVLIGKAMARHLRGEKNPNTARINERIASAKAAKAAREAGG